MSLLHFFKLLFGIPCCCVTTLHSNMERKNKSLQRDCLRLGEFLYDTKFWTSPDVESLCMRQLHLAGAPLIFVFGRRESFGEKERFLSQVKATLHHIPSPPPLTIIPGGRDSRGIP